MYSEEQNVNPYIVKFVTNEARVFKELVAFFHSSLTTLLFRISATGITLRNNNSNETLLAILHLNRQSFSTFIIPKDLDIEEENFKDLPELKIATDADLLQKVTKSILLKDKIKFFVLADQPEWLQIKIKNKSKGRNMEGKIKLLDVNDLADQFINPISPCKFLSTKPIAVGSAAEFQKACKSGKETKSKTITVTAQANSIRVSGGGEVVIAKGSIFGKWIKRGRKGDKEIYSSHFDAKIMEALAKACPMSKNVRFYCEDGKPMLISLDAGGMGILDVYLVSKEHNSE